VPSLTRVACPRSSLIRACDEPRALFMTQPAGGTGVVDRGKRGAQTMTVMYRSERAYLRQLRILGAWWCLGSSALAPRLLLLYPAAPV
jgi:hypothetical protein